MITPSFGLTATERVLPKLALDFTTATLDPRVTFTRSGNTATYTNSSGVITAINANLPRFDYNPTTLLCQGLLIEEARTNILINSLIDGTNLLTQSVTTTAVAYTLSFYGTGNIVLSGTHSATVTGTGVYPFRKTYTFTPTAGALTLTVSGTVQYAQLETGSFATSFIPTAAASVTRNADVATMTGTNFSSWFNPTQGTYQVVADSSNATGSAVTSNVVSITDGTTNNRLRTYYYADVGTQVTNLGASQAQLNDLTLENNKFYNTTVGYKVNDFGMSVNGRNPKTDFVGTVPTVTQVEFGAQLGVGILNGHVKLFNYWPQKLTSNEIQAFSKG